MNANSNPSTDSNTVQDMFELAEQYFDRPVTWLDAGEPVSVGSAGEAAERRIEVKGMPTEAGLQSLANHSFDVISLINITNHVKNPVETLQEALRVVKQSGFLFLTSYDPLYFSEASLNLRPPSYWISLLRTLHAHGCIRFGESESRFEILAAPAGCSAFPNLQASFIAKRSSCNTRIASNDRNLITVSRLPLLSNQLKDDSIFYVLNAGTAPLRSRLKLRLQENHNPDVFLGDLKLRYEGSSQEHGETVHRWKTVVLPPGGHSLRIETDGNAVTLLRMEWSAEPVEREAFTRSLPFDHYQRYRIAADILESLPHQQKTVLDVGGAKGYLRQFVPQPEVMVLDRVFEDSPYSVRYEGKEFPFADNSFSSVVCIDTLEHVPPKQRPFFLDELYRVAVHCVILACPFDETQAEEADEILRDFSAVKLGKSDRFLSEHEEYSLPNRDQTRTAFESKGFSVFEFPNGYLPRWVLMQMATFALGVSPELHDARGKLNAVYNQSYYPLDNCEPSYRWVMLATRNPLNENVLEDLRKKIFAAADQRKALDLSPALVALSTYDVVREKDAALVSSAERIENLLDHLANVEARLKAETTQQQNLLDHTKNLDADRQKDRERVQRLEEHGSNLAKLLEEKQKSIEGLQTHIQNQEQYLKDAQTENVSLQKHIGNLEDMLKANDEHSRNVQKHIDNLTAMMNEKEAHQNNLVQHAENLSSHIQSMETQVKQVQEELDHSRMENRISQWYFNTFLPRRHQPDFGEEDASQLMRQFEEELGSLPEAIQRFWKGMKELCLNEIRERKHYQAMMDELNQIQRSSSYKFLAKTGMIPKRSPTESP